MTELTFNTTPPVEIVNLSHTSITFYGKEVCSDPYVASLIYTEFLRFMYRPAVSNPSHPTNFTTGTSSGDNITFGSTGAPSLILKANSAVINGVDHIGENLPEVAYNAFTEWLQGVSNEG